MPCAVDSAGRNHTGPFLWLVGGWTGDFNKNLELTQRYDMSSDTWSWQDNFTSRRAGFGLDVTYIIDGQEVRDGASNQAFVSVPTSSIQEMELLTGGWNAEYPQANSAIVNVVTKSSRERLHGNINYRYRPLHSAFCILYSPSDSCLPYLF